MNKQKKYKIIDAVIPVTYKCNSRCRMCNIWQNQQPLNIDIAQYNKLPNTLEYINLTGGEPFLNADLPKIVELIKKKNPKAKITISTNGFATDLIIETMKKILVIDPDITVSISLDGVGEKHEQVRGILQGYQKVLNTLSKLKGLGMKNIRLAFTAGDYNIDHLPKVYNLAKREDLEMSLAAVHNADTFFQTQGNEINSLDDFENNFNYLIKQELKTWSVKHWLRAYFAYGLLEFVKTGKRILPSYGGLNSIFMDINGNVFPTDVSSDCLGNIEDYPAINDLLNSKQAQQAIAKSQADKHWMVCTVRPAMKQHPIKVFAWILKNKFYAKR